MGGFKQSESSGESAALRLIAAPAAPDLGEYVWFCGHCAKQLRPGAVPTPLARVCSACELGLLLEASKDVAPSPGDAFIVVDDRMTIQAMSAEAERLLGVDETSAVDKPVVQLLVSADSEAPGAALAPAIHAALASEAPQAAFVRPWNTFGVRMRAQIAPCGPPRAAIVVLADRGRMHPAER